MRRDARVPAAPFIVGAGRSGTTLLRLMLDSHPELAIPPEHHLWRDFGLDAATLRRELEALGPFSLTAGLRTFYGLYAARFGKRRWGDKTPPYMLHMPTIERVLAEARFVHVIRDGRDVALSAM